MNVILYIIINRPIVKMCRLLTCHNRRNYLHIHLPLIVSLFVYVCTLPLHVISCIIEPFRRHALKPK